MLSFLHVMLLRRLEFFNNPVFYVRLFIYNNILVLIYLFIPFYIIYVLRVSVTISFFQFWINSSLLFLCYTTNSNLQFFPITVQQHTLPFVYYVCTQQPFHVLSKWIYIFIVLFFYYFQFYIKNYYLSKSYLIKQHLRWFSVQS